jgi:hypothetical protein
MLKVKRKELRDIERISRMPVKEGGKMTDN